MIIVKQQKNPLEDRMGTVPSILKIISRNKPMKPSQILQKLTNIDLMDIHILINKGLIIENDDRYNLKHSDVDELFVKSHARYDLTHLGLIELFFLIFRDANLDLYWNRRPDLIKRNDSEPKPIRFQEVGKSKDPQAKEYVKELDRLRLKYVDLLPDIFNGGNFQKLGITFYEVVALLLKLYKNLDFLHEIENPIIKDIQFHTFQRLDNIRHDFYYLKIREQLDVSKEVMHMIQRNVNTRSLYWFYLNLQEPQDESTIQTLYHNQIQKKITFDFYCIYKAYCSGWNTELSKSDRRWHNQEIRTLLDFSKNYINNFKI